MSNITKEAEEIKKSLKKSEYDEYFHILVAKLGSNTMFNVKEKTLYLGKRIDSKNQNLLTLMENYKFYIAESLF